MKKIWNNFKTYFILLLLIFATLAVISVLLTLFMLCANELDKKIEEKSNTTEVTIENNIEVLEHGKLEYCNYTIIHDKEYDKEYIVIKAADNSISIIERNKDGDR